MPRDTSIHSTGFFLALLLAGLPTCSLKRKAAPEKTTEGTIVLLNGTTSVGKTTLTRELKKLSNSWEALIGDEFVETYTKKHPVSESLSRNEQQQIILSALLKHAKQLSVDGKNVFVDLVEFDDHYDHYCSIIDCTKTIKVLVYCPLDTLVDRIEKRRRTDPRPLNLAFGEFTGIYKLQESPQEKVVDRIASSRMLSALQKAKEEVRTLMQQAGVKPEDFEKNLELFAQPFVDQFKLNTRKEIVLVPKHRWDLVVNSGTHTSEELAHEIMNHIHKRTDLL
jgi:adenylylsulfate kinase-like enzyme